MSTRSMFVALPWILLLFSLLGSPLPVRAAEGDQPDTTEVSSEQAQVEEVSKGEEDEPGDEDEQELSTDEKLDALLAETISKDDYGETRRCLSRNDYRSVEILNNEYLLFKKNKEYWLNKLKIRCARLANHMILTFNPRGTTSTCANDHVWITNRFDLERGFTPTGMPVAHQGSCILGQFEEISAEQAALLREFRR